MVDAVPVTHNCDYPRGERSLADPVSVMCPTAAKRSLHLSALLPKSIAIFLFAPCLSALLCYFIRSFVSKTLRGMNAIAAEELEDPAVLKRNTGDDRWLCNSVTEALGVPMHSALAVLERPGTGCETNRTNHMYLY